MLLGLLMAREERLEQLPMLAQKVLVESKGAALDRMAQWIGRWPVD